MIEIVQDVISTNVAGPLLNGTRGLVETVKALPTGMERLGTDGITIEEVALTRCAPEEADPMLSRQIDGIGIGNGTSRVWRLTRHFVGTVHVQEIPANERITSTGSS